MVDATRVFRTGRVLLVVTLALVGGAVGGVLAIRYAPPGLLGLDGRVQQQLAAAGLGSEEAFDRRVAIGIRRFAERQQAADEQAQASAIPPVRSSDHVAGPRDARISLIEYSDFECPFCKRFHATARQLLEAYPRDVNWVYRHFPLPNHDPAALREAQAAECAAELGGNEVFWAYGNRLFERTRSNGKGIPGDALVPLAVEIGLERVRFAECLESGRTVARIERDLREGRRIGVSGTPANFLRDNETGEVVPLTGARPLQQFTRVVDRMLASSGGHQAAGIRSAD